MKNKKMFMLFSVFLVPFLLGKLSGDYILMGVSILIGIFIAGMISGMIIGNDNQ